MIDMFQSPANSYNFLNDSSYYTFAPRASFRSLFVGIKFTRTLTPSRNKSLIQAAKLMFYCCSNINIPSSIGYKFALRFNDTSISMVGIG